MTLRPLGLHCWRLRERDQLLTGRMPASFHTAWRRFRLSHISKLWRPHRTEAPSPALTRPVALPRPWSRPSGTIPSGCRLRLDLAGASWAVLAALGASRMGTASGDATLSAERREDPGLDPLHRPRRRPDRPPLAELEMAVGFDPAISLKDGSAQSALVVAGQVRGEREIFILDCEAGRWSALERNGGEGRCRRRSLLTRRRAKRLTRATAGPRGAIGSPARRRRMTA
jgi:hypothetical protein